MTACIIQGLVRLSMDLWTLCWGRGTMTGAKTKKPTKGTQTKGKPTTGKPTTGKPMTGKPTKGRQAKGKLPKKGLPWFAWLFIALAIAGAVILVRIYAMPQPSPDNPGKPRATIVDQLYNLEPNGAFIAEVTRELEDYGFEVDLYQGDEITVGFYRRLPAYGHKLIILRAHSGLMIENERIRRRTLLFTSEAYHRLWYPIEQLDDQVAMVSAARGHPVMFGITPKFVTESMTSDFDDTVIILMGCDGIALTDLAEAFIGKGASAYLAWDGPVILPYVDEAAAYLVAQLCWEKTIIKEAVASTMSIKGRDPTFLGELRYYPAGSGDKTLEELLQVAFTDEDSMSSTSE